MGNPFDSPYDNPFASKSGNGNAYSESSSAPPLPSRPVASAAIAAAASAYAAPSASTSSEARTETRSAHVLDVGRAPQPPRQQPPPHAAEEHRAEAYKEESELLPWWAKLAVPICPTHRFNVKVKIHAIFVLYYAIMVANGFTNSGERGFVSLIVIGPILFGTALFHELGHAFACRMTGAAVTSITLSPFGGMTYVGHRPSCKTDILVAIAGPLTHVPLGVLFYFLTDSSAGDWWHVEPSGNASLQDPNIWNRICYSSLVIQVTLFFLNLLVPCYPLDAGRILVDLFAVANYERESAAKTCMALSSVTGLAIFAFGVIFSIKDMTLNSCVLIGFWIVWQAWGMFRFIRREKIEDHPMFANYYADPSEGARV